MEAFEEIFNVTGGNNWTNKAGWKSPASLSEWKGVKVGKSEQVIELDLNSNNLQGNIPRCLAVLSKLTKLHLGSNELAGNTCTQAM